MNHAYDLKRILAIAVLTVLGLSSIAVAADDTGAIPQRGDIDDKYKWRVEDMYEDLAAWEADYKLLEEGIGQFEQYRGHLGDSPEMLLACLALSDSLSSIEGNLWVYAYLKLDEDNRQSEYQELVGRISALYSQLAEAEAFVEPEILTIDEQKLRSFLDSNPQLAVYTHYIDNQLRQKAHILSAEEEAILAAADPVLRAPQRIFAMIDDADHKLGKVADGEGNVIELTRGRYYRLMEGPDRDVRQRANDTVQNSWMTYLNTMSATLAASVQKDWFLARTKGYGSCLEMGLDKDNIPPTVFHQLIDAVNANMAPLHKLTSLRKRILGYDTLYTYDLSVPLVQESDREYEYEEAKELILTGLKPMGKNYLGDFEMGLASGWIDVYETEGKGSGAYSWGTYTSHPYILLNYAGMLEDVFTLAHEMGHALNSYYTNQAEPYRYHGHSLFTAEVASTCNEALMMKYLLDHAKDKDEKMVLLDYYIRQIMGTFFTQVRFSEFELAIHDRVENGEAFSADYFRETYRDIFQKYYGPELVIGENNDMAGMKISHFYRQYYVYKYATSYAAAQALSQRILEGDKKALKAYQQFLATGRSKYPIEMLKDAGIDMTSPEPVQRTIALFSELVDEMERLLDEG